jgi:hypothetical protein
MFDIKVNNSSAKCDLFNIKTDKTPYMFWPAVAIIRGSPILWGNTLHVCSTCVSYVGIFSPLELTRSSGKN